MAAKPKPNAVSKLILLTEAYVDAKRAIIIGLE